MSDSADAALKTTACIVGGGPAGMMLGFLLARAGVEVVVLEKHADFFRDFRGDTIHPSTMELMCELGLIEEFLKVKHDEIGSLMIEFDGNTIQGPDFTHLPVHCRFMMLMPQWDFLNFVAAHGRRYPTFQLRMKTEVIGLIEEKGHIVGVRAKTEAGELEVRADIVFGTDGRHSTVRQQANMQVRDFGVPIDVLWFHLDKPEHAPAYRLARVKNGRGLITLDRGDYYQTAAIIPKGSFEDIKKRGLEQFRADIVSVVPEFEKVVEKLDDWDKIKLLTVQVNRLDQWARPGLLCIGDAAHAMSPAGGVGINLAIQDAVATANLLWEKLLNRTCTTDDLALVQARREWPTRMTQGIQVRLHRQMFKDRGRILQFSHLTRIFLGLLAPLIRRVGARIVGLGFRPEHIQSPERGRTKE